uniref:Insulin-degrading enzyme n=1 Tax=Hirondellea gigas TaxID=1518452 RepID=A0A6A7G139_9CRUS
MNGSDGSVLAKSCVTQRWEDNIVRSCEDRRLYRYLKLENSLTALLISDPETDKSAASLDVHVGSMSDPWDIPGLAHFCEHMLFLGTEKFPNENDYNKYLSEHSGGSNAYTASDHTNYYFDVAPPAFKGALDRFAQFFLCPLFTESCVEREVNSVHSEHEKNLLNDYWRMAQLEKSTSNPEHAFSKFGTGSKVTLFDEPTSRGVCVRDALLQFHKEWYSANAMGLTVLGKESLEELEEVVVRLFGDVANKNITIPRWPEHPFNTTALTGYVVPVKDIRNLHMTWPLPDLREHYRTSPGHYLGHLIGHEGQGSLLSYLKEQGWVNSLVGGQKNGARGFSFFCVNVDLTEEGIEHVDDITTAVFQYINLLSSSGPLRWVFEELRDLSATSFRFKDKERPQSYVTSVSEALFYYPPEEILSGRYLLTEFDDSLISSILNQLTPQKARLCVVGKQMASKAKSSEKWYGTQYHMEPISDATLQRWSTAGTNPALVLPKPNQFIPQNLELAKPTEDVTTLPQKILETPLLSLYFKQDTEYKLPKSNMFAEFFSPIAYLDPRNTNLLHMFAQLFRDALTEYSYDAELAGLDYSLNNSKYGLTLSVHGYFDKQPVLIEKIMEKLTNFKVDPKRFEILKDMYVRALCNFSADQPHQHVVYYTSLLLSQHAWNKEELLSAAREGLTVQSMESFIPVFLSQLHCSVLVHGSVTTDWALSLAALITQPLEQLQPPTLPLLQSQRNRQRELNLPKGCSIRYGAENNVHSSSAVEVVLQGDMQSTRHNALFELVAQILHEPAYEQLRTKEQLGYIVWSGLRRSNGTQGYRIIVQSPYSPGYLDERIEAFLDSMQVTLQEMSEEDFVKHREALIQRRLEKPKKMSSLSTRWWTEIVCNQYNFDRENVEVDFLKTVTKEDVLQHYKAYVAVGGQERAKLSVQVTSTAEGGAGSSAPAVHPPTDAELHQPPAQTQQVDDVACVNSFKAGLPLFPLMKPYVSLPTTDSKPKL